MRTVKVFASTTLVASITKSTTGAPRHWELTPAPRQLATQPRQVRDLCSRSEWRWIQNVQLRLLSTATNFSPVRHPPVSSPMPAFLGSVAAVILSSSLFGSLSLHTWSRSCYLNIACVTAACNEPFVLHYPTLSTKCCCNTFFLHCFLSLLILLNKLSEPSCLLDWLTAFLLAYACAFCFNGRSQRTSLLC